MLLQMRGYIGCDADGGDKLRHQNIFISITAFVRRYVVSSLD